MKWISVEDRLPSEEDYFLVTDGYGRPWRDFYSPLTGQWLSKNEDIAFWMPLPLPPKNREINDFQEGVKVKINEAGLQNHPQLKEPYTGVVTGLSKTYKDCAYVKLGGREHKQLYQKDYLEIINNK